jgi:hypothetical protein
MIKIKNYLSLIKFSHTIFAMPNEAPTLKGENKSAKGLYI